MMKKLSLITVVLLLTASSSYAQLRQVVVMKKQNVVRRFNTGDFIRYSLSNRKHFVREKIVELTDTTIITTQDTIAYHRIAMVDIESDAPPSGITLEKIGMYSIAAGIILPLSDLINVTVVQNEKYEPDSGVIITSATLVAVGAMLMIVDKPYIKLRMTNRLRIVDRDSPLFKRVRPVASNPYYTPGN
jgi:hypothetical protein